MLGAIIGDIIGSPYEFHNIKTKDFPLFCDQSHFTDDTILTCAVAEVLLTNENPAQIFKKWGKRYQNRTYENGKVKAFGAGFLNWLQTETAYQAKTNGCIMRLSPLSLLIDDLKKATDKAVQLTNLTHNHPESILATKAYVETMFLVKKKTPVPLIKNYLKKKYGFDLSKSVDEIRPDYNRFYVSCKKSVPEAITCALEANSYEDAIRNAVSLGGDSDTLATMAGGIAELKFGVPQHIKKQAVGYLDSSVKEMIKRFYEKTHSREI